MCITEHFTNVAAYNLWANESIAGWLKTKNVQLLSEEVASSYNSLLKTLNHIWAVEQFWLSVLSEQPPMGEARYMATEFDSEEILPGLVEQSRALHAFVQGLGDQDYDKVLNLDFPWMKGQQSRLALIHHLFNHSTYHRGQVTSIGRRLGFTDAPATDYSHYNLMQLTPQH